MPLDTTGYRDFGLGLGSADVELPQIVEVQVDPARNAGADVICFYSGIRKFAAKGTSEDEWDRGFSERASAYRRATMDALARVRWSRVDGI